MDTDEILAAALRCHREGALDEARALYRRLLEAVPDHAGALRNLGVIAAQEGDPEAAAGLFARALAARPDHVETCLNLGGALEEAGRGDEALAAYGRAAALAPDLAEPQTRLGDALHRLARFEEAAGAYGRALALNADHYPAHMGRALALAAAGHREGALEHFAATHGLRRGLRPVDPDHASFRTASRLKLEHDIAQFRHLAGRGIEPERLSGLAEAYGAVAAEIAWPEDETEPVALTLRQRKALGKGYNRAVHLHPAAEAPEGALDPALDAAAITRRFRDETPGVVWFDRLLSPAALAALRRSLLDSTIWFDFTHVRGFLAAYLEDGLASPLLLQVADELRRRLPGVVGEHPLAQAWAFKGVSGDRPIEPHADDAAVSLNFWITPDAANLDPARGGLAVWTVPPPPGWRLAGYESDIGRVRDFLAAHADERLMVPYGENRAVLFDSRLFHGSDAPRFRPGYENHRINITMLFGDPSRRGASHRASG